MLILTILLLSIPFASQAYSQQPSGGSAGKDTQLSTVDQILDKYVEALGGRAAIEKIKSSRVKGTVEIPAAGVAGTVEFLRKAPNMVLTSVTVNDSVVGRTAFDGNAGWSENIRDGVKALTGEDLIDARTQADFYISVRLRQLYPKMVLDGLEKDGDSEAYVIEATPENGRPVTFHFDKSSGLLVRTDSVVVNQEGQSHSTVYFADYRDVDGVKTPCLIRGVTPLSTIIFKLTDIRNNIEIDGSKFVMPK